MTDQDLSHAAEIWKPIPGWDGYEVSDLGRVRSMARIVTRIDSRLGLVRQPVHERIRKPAQHPDGHLTMSLCQDGAQRTMQVHQLVLISFVGDPEPGQECRHLDGDPANNALYNLRWGTSAENSADSIRHGTSNIGERHGLAKLTDADVIAIRASARTNRELAEIHSVGKTTVSNIRLRKSWAHVR